MLKVLIRKRHHHIATAIIAVQIYAQIQMYFTSLPELLGKKVAHK